MKNSYIPSYLFEKRNVIIWVLGTAIFGEFFILVYKPFNSLSWAEGNVWLFIGAATLVVLTAMGLIAICRTVMYHYGKTHKISYLDYLISVLTEFVSMSVVYTLFAILFGKNNHIDDFFTLFQEALAYSALILVYPYTLLSLYFAVKEKDKQLEEIRREVDKIEAESVSAAQQDDDELLNFKDEKGELKLSIHLSALYYIESADNYVEIRYINQQKLQKYLLRTSLKRVEEEVSNRYLVRCHRSYIVNCKRINVLSRDGEGLVIQFDNEALPKIPVSKTYRQQLMDKL